MLDAMKETVFTILDNRPLTANVYEMQLYGDTEGMTTPGQFVNIRLDGLFLRRPISVCDLNDHMLTLVYKVIGKGTSQMAKMEKGDTLDLLTGLGNGYDLNVPAKQVLLLGGGVGVPPLYLLAKQLLAQGKKVSVRLGFNSADEVFYVNEFCRIGCDVTVFTVDGSLGEKGFVTTGLEKENYDTFYTCGPEPMLRAVYRVTNTSGQFSFEERMGCGFGACMGCSCKTITGFKRICREGPVLKKEEILWED